MVLQNALLDQSSILEEFDKLAGLQVLCVHRLAKGCVIAEHSVDQLPLGRLEDLHERLVLVKIVALG
jgi:hypothetical protein